MNVRMPTTKFFGADFNDAHACPGYPVIRGYAKHISAKLYVLRNIMTHILLKRSQESAYTDEYENPFINIEKKLKSKKKVC